MTIRDNLELAYSLTAVRLFETFEISSFVGTQDSADDAPRPEPLISLLSFSPPTVESVSESENNFELKLKPQ